MLQLGSTFETVLTVRGRDTFEFAHAPALFLQDYSQLEQGHGPIALTGAVGNLSEESVTQQGSAAFFNDFTANKIAVEVYR